jgi:hypothetical protein
MIYFMRSAIFLLVWSAFCFGLSAQDTKSAASEPKTKVEAFQAKSGAVIIRGFTQVGSVACRSDTSIEVQCKELTDATSGKKEFGVSVTVKNESRFAKESTSHIDYDEIDSLLKGIEYIAKIDKSATKLASFQADYKTKGDLTVSTYSNSNGEVQAAVQSGRFGGTMAFLSLSDLNDFRKLIAKSKQTLDDVKK